MVTMEKMDLSRINAFFWGDNGYLTNDDLIAGFNMLIFQAVFVGTTIPNDRLIRLDRS